MTTVVAGESYDPNAFLWHLTIAFGTIFVIGPLLVPRGPDQALIRISIMEAAFCMWLAWVTIYSAQMNPVVGPTFKNTTLAWISYSWGNGKGIEPMTLPTTTTTTRSTRASTTEAQEIRFTLNQQLGNDHRASVIMKNEDEPYKGSINFALAVEDHGDMWFQEKAEKGEFPAVRISINNDGSRLEVLENGIITTQALVDTPNIVNADDFTYFWIKWDEGDWSLGKINEEPFLIGRTNTFRVQYIHLHGVESYWLFWESSTVKLLEGQGVNKTAINETILRDNEIEKLYSFPTRTKELKETVIEEVSSQLDPKSEVSSQWESKSEVSSQWEPRSEVSSQWDPRPVYIRARSHYKFFIVKDEPIKFGVLIEDEMYREFFVLLSTTYTVSEPYILIHIGAYQGKTCMISKNGEIVARVQCSMDWVINSYLTFWIWYRHGEISIKSGYYIPEAYHPFLSWSDPRPFRIRYYGLRTSVGEEIPMEVMDAEFEY